MEHVTSSELLTLLHLRNQYRKEGRPTQRSELTQTEPGWGWLSCTQGNVITKQHIPQFSGGRGKPQSRGASLQCRPGMDTLCLIPQFSCPQPHLLNWSTLHSPIFWLFKETITTLDCIYPLKWMTFTVLQSLRSCLMLSIIFGGFYVELTLKPVIILSQIIKFASLESNKWKIAKKERKKHS